jgi:hypothetical protein
MVFEAGAVMALVAAAGVGGDVGAWAKARPGAKITAANRPHVRFTFMVTWSFLTPGARSRVLYRRGQAC